MYNSSLLTTNLSVVGQNCFYKYSITTYLYRLKTNCTNLKEKLEYLVSSTLQGTRDLPYRGH